ncbi:SIP domain-containing protein [Inquilinus sp.]|uniref:SIP domain-containing protein n=1 Tax=Inquilinus sp. TaxID=1932117 RepID=UPI003783B484
MERDLPADAGHVEIQPERQDPARHLCRRARLRSLRARPLPGIAWILERLPPDAAGHAFIEIADAGEEQPLARPAGLSLTWLHLDGTPPGCRAGSATRCCRRPGRRMRGRSCG